MTEKKIVFIFKRINGEMFNISNPDTPFTYHLSGGARDYTGQSKQLLGQQEASIQLFPGERVELSEDVQG